MAAEHVERIGARIRKRREELELSRPKLVERMQGTVTENDLYRWERGQHRPGDDTLADIASALGVDASYFLVPEPAEGVADLMTSLRPAPTQLDQLEALEASVRQMHEKLDQLLEIFGVKKETEPLGDLADAALEIEQTSDAERQARDAKTHEPGQGSAGS